MTKNGTESVKSAPVPRPFSKGVAAKCSGWSGHYKRSMEGGEESRGTGQCWCFVRSKVGNLPKKIPK